MNSKFFLSISIVLASITFCSCEKDVYHVPSNNAFYTFNKSKKVLAYSKPGVIINTVNVNATLFPLGIQIDSLSIVNNKRLDVDSGDTMVLYLILENEYKDANWDVRYEFDNKEIGSSSKSEENFTCSFTVLPSMSSGWLMCIANGEKKNHDEEYYYEQKDSIFINIKN